MNFKYFYNVIISVYDNFNSLNILKSRKLFKNLNKSITAKEWVVENHHSPLKTTTYPNDYTSEFVT